MLGDGDRRPATWSRAAARVLAIVALVLPMLGIGYVLTRLVRQCGRLARWRRTDGSPVRRALAALVAAGAGGRARLGLVRPPTATGRSPPTSAAPWPTPSRCPARPRRTTTGSRSATRARCRSPGRAGRPCPPRRAAAGAGDGAARLRPRRRGRGPRLATEPARGHGRAPALDGGRHRRRRSPGSSPSTGRCPPRRATTRRWRSTPRTTRSSTTSPSRSSSPTATRSRTSTRPTRLRQLHRLRRGRGQLPGRAGRRRRRRRRPAEPRGVGDLRLPAVPDLRAGQPARHHRRRPAERRHPGRAATPCGPRSAAFAAEHHLGAARPAAGRPAGLPGPDREIILADPAAVQVGQDDPGRRRPRPPARVAPRPRPPTRPTRPTRPSPGHPGRPSLSTARTRPPTPRPPTRLLSCPTRTPEPLRRLPAPPPTPRPTRALRPPRRLPRSRPFRRLP